MSTGFYAAFAARKPNDFDPKGHLCSPTLPRARCEQQLEEFQAAQLSRLAWLPGTIRAQKSPKSPEPAGERGEGALGEI